MYYPKYFDLQATNFYLFFSIPFLEASAKSGENVTEAINVLLDMVVSRMRDYMTNMDDDGSHNLSGSPSRSTDDAEKKRSCCS